MPSLTDGERDAFLDERHTLVIMTFQPDGMPHLTTVWYRWDGEQFWISTNRDRQKYRNLERDPRVGVLVDAPAREMAVSGYGMAQTAAHGEAAYEGSLAVVSRYVEDPVAYLGDPSSEPRVLVAITPIKLMSWRLP